MRVLASTIEELLAASPDPMTRRRSTHSCVPAAPGPRLR